MRYGLQDGEYKLEKELELVYEVWREDKIMDVTIYFEHGRIVEETDITNLD